MKDAINGAAINDGSARAGAIDRDIARDVQIAGCRRVFAYASNRQSISSSRNSDRVVACGSIGGDDRFAQRAIGVTCAIGSISSFGDGEPNRRIRGGDSRHRKGQNGRQNQDTYIFPIVTFHNYPPKAIRNY